MSLGLGGMQSLSVLMGGMDYSQIIQQLDAANRAPGDALNQVLQTYQQKRNNWSDISTSAQKLQDALVTLADSSTFNSYAADVSNTTLVNNQTTTTISSASAATGSVPGTYNINVTTQGIPAKFSPTNEVGKAVDGTTASISSTLYNQSITSGTVTVTVGGTSTTYTIPAGDTETIDSVFSNLFGSNNVTRSYSGNKVTFTNNSGQTVVFGSAGDTSNFLQVMSLNGQSIGSGAGAQYTSGLIGHVQLSQYLEQGSANFSVPVSSTTAGEMDINGQAINYNTQTATLKQIMNAINSSKAGVTASYDSLNDKIVLTSNTSQPITVKDVTGNLGQALGFDAGTGTSGASNPGTQWQYTVNNGATQYSASATVANIIPGLTFTMQSSGTSTITVSQDTDTLKKNVQAFATAFNDLYSKLKQYTGKGASMQGDAAMSQLAFKYMNDILQSHLPNVPSNYTNDTVMEIGISNGAVGSAPGTTNSIQVDTTKLISAFQNDPNKVTALLQGMAAKLNGDLTNLTGSFNLLTPITPSNLNLHGLAQSEENMYDQMKKNTLKQQQSIYDSADQQAQQMTQQFQQLQQYQSQIATQQNILRGMFGI